MATRQDALREVADGIERCFGDVDLRFGSGVAGEGSVRGLTALATRRSLSREEIRAVIQPRLLEWLDHGYTRFGETIPGPWDPDPAQRRMKAEAMAIEAAWHLASR